MPPLHQVQELDELQDLFEANNVVEGFHYFEAPMADLLYVIMDGIVVSLVSYFNLQAKVAIQLLRVVKAIDSAFLELKWIKCSPFKFDH